MQRYLNSIFVIGMLVSGTCNTLTQKWQNETESKGQDGQVEPFNHPWFQTCIMFIGETLCLLLVLSQRVREKYIKKVDKEYGPIFSFIFFLPAMLDLSGSTFYGIGLVYVSSSATLMLRGSVIIFTGILSVIFLKRKLYSSHYVGMGFVVLGCICVGCSSVLGGQGVGSADESTGLVIVGILFILVGQLCSATQFVVEETYLKNRSFQPLNVVGMEGLFGASVCALIVLPVLYFVPLNSNSKSFGADLQNVFHENALDALIQISNSGRLLAFCLIYICSIAFYNFCGLSVTKNLTTIHRTLIDACRTVTVWLVDIFITYVIKEPAYGESWLEYSWLQVIGFVLLLAGTVIYNGVIKIPFLRYEEKPEQVSELPINKDEFEKYPLIGANSSSL